MATLSAGVYRITCSGFLYGSETWANVFHVDVTGSPTDAAVLDAFENVYSVNHTGGGLAWLDPCRGNAGGIVGVQLTALSLQALVTPAPPVIRNVAHNGGQNTAGGLPVDTSIVVSWRTGLAGRSYRGRTYLPPWHETKNDDSTGTFPVPDSTTVTGITVNAAGLISELAGISAPLVVYSRTLSSAHTITGGFVDLSWDTQRRRGKSLPDVKVLF
jgi:hypothetical protein